MVGVKVPEADPNGVRVRLINLPKKKNIHKDLKAAFKPFSGIINIFPAVLGHEKTREPVCKGFAFVDFKSEKEANRFVDIISNEPITFGKVQKQIRCEIVTIPTPVTETSFDSYEEDAAFDTFKTGDENNDEKGKKKMKLVKKKVENKQKLNIPESAANRLKMKEKADLLSGGFSKYGGKFARNRG